MSTEYYPVGSKKCLACIQWTGERYLNDKGIRADATKEAMCLITRKLIKGGKCCKQFFPLR